MAILRIIVETLEKRGDETPGGERQDWRRLVAHTMAGPPFLTDDPVPVDYQHWEAYLFTMGMSSSGGGYSIEGPAVELNYGAWPDTQLHLIMPMTSVGGPGTPAASGLGDIEVGLKYRFIHESDTRPQIGTFPMADCPVATQAVDWATAERGFGYQFGRRKVGLWTTYGGAGAALNSAPGQRNYPFGGWLLQRNFGKHLTLGGEIFAQEPDTDSDNGFAALDFGGFYNVTEHFSILFTGGHTVAGDCHPLWYFRLYETW